MSTVRRIALCLAASAALAAGLAAQAATKLAEQPLKASVLAKPNVIFGMDDSGSMDWEILLDTDSGLLFWNRDNQTAWDATRQKPLRTINDWNDNRTFNSHKWPYAYLFPVGTGAGGAIYDDQGAVGQAAPPVKELAWIRSSRFNPLYYDSRVTYPAWSSAYVNSALRTYGNASYTAATAHPAVAGAPTLNLSQDWNDANNGSNFRNDPYRFLVKGGMTLPAGTRVNSSSSGSGQPCEDSLRTINQEQKVPAGRSCWASIPYYPATFWHWESCSVGAGCIAAPDSNGTLKRYEIRSGNTMPWHYLDPAKGENCVLGANCVVAPDGVGKLRRRAYAEEIQNFANWFSYYRKRKLMLAGAMGRVMENISGLRMAVVPFNENPTVTMLDADDPVASKNRLAVAGKFYLNSMDALGTPTHQTVKNIAKQFADNNSVVEYACQRNNMFIVTDGFSNTTSIGVPSYSKSTWGGSQPYSTTPTGSLADLALAYYTNRLRTDLPAGKVPISGSKLANADINPDLHINTYGITLGVRGSLWPNSVDPFVVFPTWPTPVADDPSMIDDQWHATINGRGRMYLATNPDETVANLRAGLDDMISQRNTQGAVAVSSINLTRGDTRAYQTKYDPSGWTGDVEKVAVNAATGDVSSTPGWCASLKLKSDDWSQRIIASYNGTQGVAFDTMGSVVNAGSKWSNTGQLMNYLRGDVSLEGTVFRSRKKLKTDTELLARCGVDAANVSASAVNLLGAVINAEPTVDRTTGMVYVASGEGMLHAFDAETGVEHWAYVPGAVLPDIEKTASRSYTFKTQLDGTPVVRNIGSKRLLVAGMGVAGRGYYALDVTSPKGLNVGGLASKVKWEFPAAGDTTMAAKVGQTVGRPLIVKLPSDQYAVVVTSGYNNNDGKGYVWLLNPETGAVLSEREYKTTEGALAAEAGLAHLSAFAESNGSVRYVYGGDLLGNVWAFDLSLGGTASNAVRRLAQLKGPTGVAQPVTSAPELLAYEGKRIVYVGTGRLLHNDDFGDAAVQSVYAISDGTALGPSARTSLVQQTLDYSTGTLAASTAFDWTTHRGWYVDLETGDQVNTRPSMGYGALAVVGNKAGKSDCSASSRLYLFDVLSGRRFAGAPGMVITLSTTSNSTAPVLVLTTQGQVRALVNEYEQGRGSNSQVATSPALRASKNAWREIRR